MQPTWTESPGWTSHQNPTKTFLVCCNSRGPNFVSLIGRTVKFNTLWDLGTGVARVLLLRGASSKWSEEQWVSGGALPAGKLLWAKPFRMPDTPVIDKVTQN